VTSAAERSHLSIGEVLSLLQDDFPDVTISKIRFSESQGLLDPERTPSGYRKFYDGDIERLRWILRHQRDHFLPLKVMKERLAEAEAAGLVVPPDEPPAAPVAGTPSLFETGDGSGAPEAVEPAARSSRPTSAAARSSRKAPAMPELPPRPATNPLDAGPTGVSFPLDELSEACGLTRRELDELARFGLHTGQEVAGDTVYDGDAVIVARAAASFVRFGIEARHLRMYKVAAEREAGFMEQVVMPLLKQRNPTARQQAAENIGEMATLGEQLRAALLRGALRHHTDLR
jgi:DNA-binding transcriptional MerR regulator